MMMEKKTRQKQTLSTKVTVTIKEKIDKEAQEKGISTSEHLADILEKYEEQKEHISWLENELNERNLQTNRLQNSLEGVQANLTEAHKLQNNAESRNRELNKQYIEVMEDKQLLVTEVETVKNKSFWQRLMNK